jgi:hypothetical protein
VGTTESADGRLPTGFFVALPQGWQQLDVNPKTAAVSARMLVEQASRNSEALARNRAAFEQMLVGAAAEAARANVEYCACWFQPVEGPDGTALPVQASVTVAFHSLDSSNDPTSMLTELLGSAAGSSSLDLVELDAGPAIKRGGRRREALAGMDEPVEYLARQYYVPVPGSTNKIALLSFASPTLELADDLERLFDAMARSFTFTWSSHSRS